MTDVHLPPGSSGSPLLDQIRAERPGLQRRLWTVPTDWTAPADSSKVLDIARPPTRNQLAIISEPPMPAGSPLDMRLTFEEFMVGTHNQLAFLQAQRCALALLPLYNPLYIYGGTGLGKTHLLQAIAHAGRRVLYLTAQRSIYEFLRRGDAADFRLAMQGVHILAVDDLQLLRGAEVALLVQCFLESGRQLVVAADRPPGDLDRIDTRIRSRLNGGLCVEVGALDAALRVKIIESRVARAKQADASFELAPDVVGYVANRFGSNVRDIDGAVNRLLAQFVLCGQFASVESTMRLLHDVSAPPKKKIRVEEIQQLVADHFKISRGDLLSWRRMRPLVRPRQIAMYLSKVLTPRSLLDIGQRFGGREHTTILYSVRKITRLMKSDAKLAAQIEELKGMLLK